MARKTYDLSDGSLLGQFGFTSAGGTRLRGRTGFVSYEQAASFIESEGYNLAASGGGRWQATHGYRRPFIAGEKIDSILSELRATKPRPVKEWGAKLPPVVRRQLSGGIVPVHLEVRFPKGFTGELTRVGGVIQRFELVQSKMVVISNTLTEALKQELYLLKPAIQQIIAGVIQKRVYDTDVEVIRYSEPGKPRHRQWSDRLSRTRTYNLMRAFTDSVEVLPGGGFTFGVNEELAPYWLWVERGHRVFIPAGSFTAVETGSFIVGRPFVDEISTRVAAFLTEQLTRLAKSTVEEAVFKLGKYIFEGTGYSALSSKEVMNWPSMGYGKAFERHVGLIP